MNKVEKEPTLRFPEFDGDWETIELNQLIELSSKKYNPEKNYKNYRCIELEHLSQETGNLLGYTSSKEQNSIKNVFKKNQILFGKLRPYLKKYWKASFDGVCSTEVWVLDGIKVTNKYLFQLIQSNKFNQIANISSGSKMPRSDWKYMSEIPFSIPYLKKEQQKIAAFLTAVDSKIEQLTKKQTLLGQYKKGVMQKIFSQEIRFKADDGSDYPDWEEKKLGDFLVPTLREVNKPQTNYLAIGIRSHCKGTFQKPESDPNKNSMDNLFQVKEHDLVVNITFAWEGAIAIVKKEDENGLVSHRFPTYTFKNDITSYQFFQNVFVQKKFRLMLDLISPGGAGRNRVMSKKDFLKLKWNMPVIEEQQKIANFLSSIDKKIEQVRKQLDATKQFKKALLQQMFV